MSRSRGSNTTTMRLDARRVIDPRLSWFVVQTVPGLEAATAMSFVGTGVGVWLPHFRAVTIRRGRRAEADGWFFPGYLFAGLDPNRHDTAAADALWANPHILGVLGQDRPLRMQALVLQVLADRLTGNCRSERLSAAAAFRVGEMRQVIHGPFASFMAEVTEVLASGRIKVDVSVFGRATPVELDPNYLDAA